MINVLLEKFNRIHPVSEELKQRLQEAGYEKKYHAGQIVLPEGQVANNLGFVMSGLARSYLLIGKDDISTRFMTEGHFITSW